MRAAPRPLAVTGVLAAIVTWVVPGPVTAQPAPPVSEQHAHIAGDPGDDEVDLALRVSREGGGGDGGGDSAGDRARYTFEPTGADPDPCLSPDTQLTTVVRNTPGPDGGTATPLLTGCITTAVITLPETGITPAQAASLLRRVVLPGGAVRATPGGAGLAGLDAYFWLEGAEQAPVDLAIGSSVLRAEFSVTAHRWSFGDGADQEGPPSAHRGRDSPVRHVYQRGGVYPVTVEVVWTARGSLNGVPVARVDGLVSRATLRYRVDELYGVLR